MRRFQPLQCQNFALDFLFFCRRLLILLEYGLIQSEHDEIDYLIHVFIDILLQDFIFHQLLLDLLIEFRKTLPDSRPIIIILAESLAECGGDFLLEHFLNELINWLNGVLVLLSIEQSTRLACTPTIRCRTKVHWSPHRISGWKHHAIWWREGFGLRH